MSYSIRSASNQPCLLKEKETGLKWIANPGPPSLESLEEEIRVLRSKMEQMYLEKLSFNNDAILEISRLLDDKIYLYLELDKGRSR